MSEEDIEKGARWSQDITKELELSNYGIICVTRTNIEAPWLNFEAGALSKTVEFSRVTPFLFGMSPTDLKGPLVQFQACLFTEKDVGRLVSSLNDACGEERLETARLDRSLAMW